MMQEPQDLCVPVRKNAQAIPPELQLASWQLTDAFGQLSPVDCDNQRDIRNRFL